MTHEARYKALIEKLDAFEDELGIWLVDTQADEANGPDSFRARYESAAERAHREAARAGYDINELLGEVVF